MKKVIAAVILAFLFATPSMAGYIGGQGACSSSIAISTTTTAPNVTVVLSTGLANAQDVVCGYSVAALATTGVQFEYGKGTACGTGTTVATGVYPFAANGSIQYGPSLSPALTPSTTGYSFCMTVSTATTISGAVSFGQY